MTQEELIARYERNLEKVRKVYGENGTVIDKGYNHEYVEFAEKELEAVKNGRNW